MIYYLKLGSSYTLLNCIFKNRLILYTSIKCYTILIAELANYRFKFKGLILVNNFEDDSPVDPHTVQLVMNEENMPMLKAPKKGDIFMYFCPARGPEEMKLLKCSLSKNLLFPKEFGQYIHLSLSRNAECQNEPVPFAANIAKINEIIFGTMGYEVISLYLFI